MDFVNAIYEIVPKANSIEIIPQHLLPPGFEAQGWCFIDGVLGIVNKTLAINYVKLCRTNTDCSSVETILVSLLATHDNVKVINSRKRMCLQGAISATDEWALVTVLLKSHLYKHSKSSMLWHHRRWLVLNFDIASSVESEFSVVKQAALHHPKNYYAWGYLRWWCERYSLKSKSERLDELSTLVEQLCSENLGDVSMWGFLHWLQVPYLEEHAKATDQQFPGHEAILAAVKHL